MEVEPEVFDEYRLPQEPILIDDSVLKIRNILKSKKMKVVDFLKAFPRNKRLDIVDILRGALPIPIDYKELESIAKVVEMSDEETFDIWEDRFKQVLELNGMNIYSNSELVSTMLDCAKKFVSSKQ